MFGYQWFLEVLHSLKAHKVRTVFTGFGVMWAMLILVFLQGIGAGFYNGMLRKFYSYNSRFISIHKGYSRFDSMNLTEALTEDLARNINIFEQVMPIFQTTSSVGYQKNLYKTDIVGIGVGYDQIKDLELLEGRFFRERDFSERLPICILGLKIKTKLFDIEKAVGKFITIGGTLLSVVGVLEPTARMDDDKIIIPSSLFKGLFPEHSAHINQIISTLVPKQSPIEAEKKIRAYLGKRLNFDPKDKEALHINSSSKRARFFQILFMVMQGFIWLVGLCFLVSGVFGIGNMMLVVVKERTQELAIRKVLGAKSSDIIGLILIESIVINLISGILGLGIGLVILRWMDSYLAPIMEQHGIAHLEFEFSMVLAALVILVLSGCVAGIIPAKRALCIKPVDALNNE